MDQNHANRPLVTEQKTNWRKLTDQSSWRWHGEQAPRMTGPRRFPAENVLASSHQSQANCCSQSGIGLSGSQHAPEKTFLKNCRKLASQLAWSTQLQWAPSDTTWKPRPSTWDCALTSAREPRCNSNILTKWTLARSKHIHLKTPLEANFYI